MSLAQTAGLLPHGCYVLVDALFGAIPIIGTIFDIWFRANERNLKLMVDQIQRHRRP